MEGKKDLSAARRKLQEYKQSKGQGRGGGTTFVEVNETGRPPTAVDTNAASAVIIDEKPQSPTLISPPPREDIPTYLDNMAQNLMGKGQGETKVLNVDVQDQGGGETSTTSSVSDIYPPRTDEYSIPSPDAMAQQEGQYQVPADGSVGGVTFFQSTPISHDYQRMASNFSPQQEFYYQNTSSQPSAPLFFNVQGGSITPMTSVYGNETAGHNSDSSTPLPSAPELDVVVSQSTVAETRDESASSSPKLLPLDPPKQVEMFSTLTVDVDDLEFHKPSGRNNTPTTSSKSVHFSVPSEAPVSTFQRKIPTPTLRRVTVTSQEEKERLELQTLHTMKSVQDALEMQLTELRRDNERLLYRQSELVSQLEQNEKAIQELRRERDRCKEEAKKLVQPLNVKINNLYEENQRILKNSNDVGMELRSKLQEKTKQHEDIEQAFIVVSTSKMELASELDQEREKVKLLESQLSTRDEQIEELKEAVLSLEQKAKVEQQKDVIIHQLEDQIRHYQMQAETVQRELRIANNKIDRLTLTRAAEERHMDAHVEIGRVIPITLPHPQPHGKHHHHDHDPPAGEHQHSDHEHAHDVMELENEHHHSHEHVGHDDHNHGGLDHDHEHSHRHDHSCEHDHHHHHEENGTPGADSSEVPQKRQPRNEFLEMKKRLHHLEWENSTFRSDLDKLSEEARAKRQLEEKFAKISEECNILRNECQRLEMLVVQLQGENDTIGDYIALYQSQKLAIQESARERDQQLALLAKERHALLQKLEELSRLIKILKQQREGLDIESCGHSELECKHSTAPSIVPGQSEEIEGKIRHLLSEIGSSSLIENFHPCAVCSGRLMNV